MGKISKFCYKSKIYLYVCESLPWSCYLIDPC
jgi:hypothetical protein